MIAPPCSFETEIAIAERASERDLSYIRRRRERRRGGLESGERAVDLAGLMIEPFRLVPLRPAKAGPRDRQDRGIHPPRRQALDADGGLRRWRSSSDGSFRRSAGDDEVDGFRALALLVGLDVEGEALPLAQRFEPGLLDRGDVHEHVAATVVGLDEAVAALGVEKLDRTCHGHRETPFPVVAPPPTRTARRLGRTFSNGESSGLTASVTPPAPTGGGTSKPAR